jgi:ABC-type molybdate transport system substrate-binding protein
MSLSVTSFSGKAAGFYISAALKEAKSLEYLTMIENVKYKSNIQKQALSGVLADATCDFTAAGQLTMTENVLEPKLSTS